MPFQTWSNSASVTLDVVHQAFWRCLADSAIIPEEAVYLVLDDEGIPLENPPFKRFITVRLPSLAQEFGEVFQGTSAGGLSDLDRLMVTGQCRVTLWLKTQTDIWGRFDSGAKIAIAPKGGALLGRMVRLLKNKMLVNSGGENILNRSLRFVSYDAPGTGYTDWRPFRLTFEISFTWDLDAEQPAA